MVLVLRQHLNLDNGGLLWKVLKKHFDLVLPSGKWERRAVQAADAIPEVQAVPVVGSVVKHVACDRPDWPHDSRS